MKEQITYKLSWITIGVIIWEVLFWGVFLLLGFTLGWNVLTDEIPPSGEQLRFEHPRLLLLLAVLPLFIILFLFNIRWRNKVLFQFSNRLRGIIFSPLSSSNTFLRFFFFRNAFAFLIISLANPQFGSKDVGGKAESMEIIVALDISKSMLVPDMDQRINRLSAAKTGLIQLINQLHGDKIGLIVFAGKAYPQLPLTNDYGAAKLFVNEISTDMISNQGTNIPDALQLALESFSGDETSKAIVVITDGENHEGNTDEVMSLIREKNIIVHAIGLGSSKGGPVPEPRGGFKKDENGEIVVSRVNPELVKNITETGGGTFLMESSRYPNFKPLIEATQRMEKGTVDSASFKISQQHGTTFALLSLLFLILSMIWTDSRLGLFTNLIKS